MFDFRISSRSMLMPPAKMNSIPANTTVFLSSIPARISFVEIVALGAASFESLIRSLRQSLGVFLGSLHGTSSASSTTPASISVRIAEFMAMLALRFEHAGVSVAPLGNAILHIVGVGTKEKVFGIYARRIVASMQNIAGVFPGERHPQMSSESMGFKAFASEPSISVALRIFGVNPIPAMSTRINDVVFRCNHLLMVHPGGALFPPQ